MKFLKNNKGKKNNKNKNPSGSGKTKIIDKQKSSDTRIEKKQDGTIVKTVVKTTTYKKVPMSEEHIKKDTRIKYFMIFLAIMLKVLAGASSVYQLNQLYNKIQQDIPSKELGEDLVSRMKKIAVVVISKHKSDTVAMASLVFVLKDLIVKAYLTMKYGNRINKNQAKVLAEQAAIETSMNIVFAFMNKMMEKTINKEIPQSSNVLLIEN